MGVTPGAVLAIDGGNSKTEVALAAADGSILAGVQVGGFTPQADGVAAAVAVAGRGVALIRAELGLAADQPLAELLAAYVAGADFPVEVEALTAEFAARGWAGRTVVDNDAFALLRSGTSRPWGVAVVCGAGMNCVGIAPDGRHARFPAVGAISGDWGGGGGIGEAAHWYAVRAEDGRGAPTVLRKAVAEYFGCASMAELVEALHFRRIGEERLVELAPLVFEVAGLGDEVALSIVERLADEVCAWAFAALARLELMEAETEVVLGGGVLRARQPLLMTGIERRFAERAPRAVLTVADRRPIHGAVLLGLDELARSR